MVQDTVSKQTAQQLLLTVISPTRKIIIDMPVSEATLPGAAGQMQVLPQHEEFMSLLKVGVLSYHPVGTQEEKRVAVSHGFAEIQNNKVLVLASTAETKEDLDLDRITRAKEKAEKTLEDGVDLQNMRKYELKLERAVVRASLFGK